MSSIKSAPNREAEAACAARARLHLSKGAEETVFYLALRRLARRELAEEFGLSEETVGGILSQQAVKLVDEIRRLG